MKSSLFEIILFTFLISACNKEEINLVDYCPTCTASIELNGIAWPAKPHLAWFQIPSSNDTFFTLEINQINPTHDPFQDLLYFSHIPYVVGEIKLDSSTYLDSRFFIGFDVFEVEYGTPGQSYFPIYDGTGSINLESLNKNTGEYFLTFNLTFYPNGDPNAIVHNSTYPNKVQINGSSQGMVTYE